MREHAGDSEEERLRRENRELQRQLDELQRAGGHAASPARLWRPSGITIWAIFLAAGRPARCVAFFAGYLPLAEAARARHRREAREQAAGPAARGCHPGGRCDAKRELELPGNIQAITEAPILARADGYIEQPPGRHRRSRRSRPGSGRNRSAGTGAAGPPGEGHAAADAGRVSNRRRPTLKQGKSDTELARVTAERYAQPPGQGACLAQENDQYQAQYQSTIANVQALEKAIAVQRSNVAAAQANLARLERMQSYRIVNAPFDGVITLRNVDIGALVNAGSTLLFRIAQTGTLRTYVNVPQATPAPCTRADGAAERLQPARPPVHRHGSAHLEFARSRQPHAAGGDPGAESGWRPDARHVRARGPESARGRIPLLVPERRADRARGDGARSRSCGPTTPSICRRSKSAATTAIAWKSSAACTKATSSSPILATWREKASRWRRSSAELSEHRLAGATVPDARYRPAACSSSVATRAVSSSSAAAASSLR